MARRIEVMIVRAVDDMKEGAQNMAPTIQLNSRVRILPRWSGCLMEWVQFMVRPVAACRYIFLFEVNLPNASLKISTDAAAAAAIRLSHSMMVI